MTDEHTRLAACFQALFPELSNDQIASATSDTIREWDSVAGVTLIALIEEEFGIVIEADDLSRFTSFQGFLDYLQNDVASSCNR